VNARELRCTGVVDAEWTRRHDGEPSGHVPYPFLGAANVRNARVLQIRETGQTIALTSGDG
jgi:hypothetical protein